MVSEILSSGAASTKQHRYTGYTTINIWVYMMNILLPLPPVFTRWFLSVARQVGNSEDFGGQGVGARRAFPPRKREVYT